MVELFWVTCDNLTDLIFFFDILVQFRTGYLEQGLVVYDSKKLALHYVKSRSFVLDFMALIPLQLLQHTLGTCPILRFPRFLKVSTQKRLPATSPESAKICSTFAFSQLLLPMDPGTETQATQPNILPVTTSRRFFIADCYLGEPRWEVAWLCQSLHSRSSSFLNDSSLSLFDRFTASTTTTTWWNREQFTQTFGALPTSFTFCWYWLTGSAVSTTCCPRQRSSKATGSSPTTRPDTTRWRENTWARCTGQPSPSPPSETCRRRKPMPSKPS